ncbi:MAG: hypothetical protein MZV65_30085 [Chromatiales bacterium]|nr:hypothetical protein [Chromatiales bacterium]
MRQKLNNWEHPDARVLLEAVAAAGDLLDVHADFGKGSTTGDSSTLSIRGFWELDVKLSNPEMFAGLTRQTKDDIMVWSGVM